MLSVIPLAARGPAQIFVFDIHALQERFYFSDQVIPRLVHDNWCKVPVFSITDNVIIAGGGGRDRLSWRVIAEL